jgi:hypothetical protein
MVRRMNVAVAGVLACCLLFGSSGRAQQRVPVRNWHDEKCARYGKAWSDAVGRVGAGGLSPAFLQAHAAFLASNCTRRADVCPRTPADFALANMMVVLSMNAGTASTFPPFACRS